MNTPRYLDTCPVECSASVEPTDIILEQGCLEKCTGCGQFFSQCSKQEFDASMEEFNSEQGTWPPPENVSSLERSTQKTLKQVTSLIDQSPDRLKLLDVGCSNGAFIYTAAKFGVHCEGVEPAEQAALAAQKAGLKVYHGFLEQSGLESESYDVITLFEVIEHLKHPVELLTECHRLLKKNGVMVIRTANTDSWTVKILKGKWHYFDITRHGGHISFFCRDSMAKLGRKTGFNLVRFLTHSVTLSEKKNRSVIVYRFFKILSEILNLPAKLSGNGQEMEVYLKKV